MDSREKLNFLVAVLIASCIALFIISITVFNIMEDIAKVDLVKAGANPIEAACLIEDSHGTSVTCIVLTAKK